MDPKTSQTLCMVTYGKGFDSEKLAREVEPKQSDNWKLQWFFSAPKFCSKSINQVVDVAKLIAERKYNLFKISTKSGCGLHKPDHLKIWLLRPLKDGLSPISEKPSDTHVL